MKLIMRRAAGLCGQQGGGEILHSRVLWDVLIDRRRREGRHARVLTVVVVVVDAGGGERGERGVQDRVAREVVDVRVAVGRVLVHIRGRVERVATHIICQACSQLLLFDDLGESEDVLVGNGARIVFCVWGNDGERVGRGDGERRESMHRRDKGNACAEGRRTRTDCVTYSAWAAACLVAVYGKPGGAQSRSAIARHSGPNEKKVPPNSSLGFLFFSLLIESSTVASAGMYLPSLPVPVSC